MNQMKRRNFLRVGLGSAAVLVAPKTFAAEKALDLSSKQVAALFSEFAQTKKMLPELKAWLDDPVIQKIPPYKVFDNVWYVGLRWVAAYLIKTNDGYILIDTLHPPFVGHLIDNLALLNVDPSEIKYVLMTHGHFDHVGGATTLKPLFKNAKFAMGEKSWEESFEHLGKGAGPKTMIPKEMVLKDGETVTLGNTTVRAIATPGHTEGTFSYVYPVYADGKKYTAVTIGGVGLNTIKDKSQLEEYIRSLDKLSSNKLDISVNLTAHPFSTGQTELIEKIKNRKLGEPHLLVSRSAFLQYVDGLKAGAEKMLNRGKFN